MTTPARRYKSTNVRFNSQQALRGLAKAIPWLGDRLLSEQFLKAPPRLSVRDEERAVLARARPGQLTVGSETVQTWHWGHGPKVLLVHGHGGSAAQLSSFVEPLLAAGFSVLAYDAPGHGQSSGQHASLVSLADALGEVLAQLGPVHAVIAHSLGGAAVCLAAKHGARIDRAVLISPPSDVRHWYQRFVSALELSEAQAGRVRLHIERRVNAPMHTLQAALLGPHLHAATLVIHDRDDKEVAFEDGQRVLHSIADAQLMTTEGLGHRRILRDAQVIERAVAFATQGERLTDSFERLLDRELFHVELRLASA